MDQEPAAVQASPLTNRLGSESEAAMSPVMAKDDYREELRTLEIALVKYQQWAIAKGSKAVLVLEGRDAAGKDGAIRRITAHLAPRETRAISLPKPNDRERSAWYFQRYVAHLPAAGEFVIFNRSWYNRAGVEPVMGFCTPEEHENFLRDVPGFERMLEEAGIRLIKIWLDISKEEQADRLEARRKDPVKALKVSDLDGLAQKKWAAYSAARDQMFERTHTDIAPWIVVATDHKKRARLNVIRYLLRTLAPSDIAKKIEAPDPKVLFPFEPSAITDGRLSR